MLSVFCLWSFNLSLPWESQDNYFVTLFLAFNKSFPFLYPFLFWSIFLKILFVKIPCNNFSSSQPNSATLECGMPSGGSCVFLIQPHYFFKHFLAFSSKKLQYVFMCFICIFSVPDLELILGALASSGEEWT